MIRESSNLARKQQHHYDQSRMNGRKPLKRFVGVIDPNNVKPMNQDDVFMLEKTDYTSSSGSFGSDEDRFKRKRGAVIHNGYGIGHVDELSLKTSANRVQNMNRAVKRIYNTNEPGIHSSDCNSCSSSRSSDASVPNVAYYHSRNNHLQNSQWSQYHRHGKRSNSQYYY